jgi:hypothetical protein
MGTKTRDEMVERIRFKLDNRSTSDVTDEQIEDWLNDAYDHVCRPNIFRHRELQDTHDITLVANDRDYALASDHDFIYTVFNVDEGIGLHPRDLRQFDRTTIVTGQPRFYDTWGTNLVINCNPDSASVDDVIRVRYWKTRDRLTSDAATTIHERWDEVIIEGATWRGWKDLNNIDRADQSRDEFARMINEMVDIAKIEAEDWGQSAEPEVQPVMRVS